jgi:hypothetical protein
VTGLGTSGQELVSGDRAIGAPAAELDTGGPDPGSLPVAEPPPPPTGGGELVGAASGSRRMS